MLWYSCCVYVDIPTCVGIVVGILYTFVYYNSLPRVKHNCCTVAIVVPRSFCNNFWGRAAPYLYTYCIIIILLCTYSSHKYKTRRIQYNRGDERLQATR